MSSLDYRSRPSPNFGPRAPGAAIDILLLHYTGMASAAAALDRLCDPASQVSCHWLVEEDGTVWKLVEEQHRAWHAGRSWWAGVSDINSRSIGVELVNPGHELGYRPFPLPQMTAFADLARAILARHAIPRCRVLGHSDVAPERKSDPGELFDWAWLADQGIGLWPAAAATVAIVPDQGLRRIGYRVEGTDPDPAVIAAFQRHFLPHNLSGILDAETRGRISAVAAALA